MRKQIPFFVFICETLQSLWILLSSKGREFVEVLIVGRKMLLTLFMKRDNETASTTYLGMSLLPLSYVFLSKITLLLIVA